MKKLLLLLLCISLLVFSGCGPQNVETIADQLALTEEVAEPEPVEEVSEPEPEIPGIRLAISAQPEELLQTSFAQNLYLPLLCFDGESYHSHVITYAGMGGNQWKLTVLEGLADSNGNAFTAEDLEALLRDTAGFTNLQVTGDSVTLTLTEEENGYLEQVLCSTYAVTRASAAVGEIPAGFGPYLISEIREDALILTPNPACPETDCSCTAAENAKFELLFGITPEEQTAMLAEGTIDGALDPAEVPEGCEALQFFTGSCTFLVCNLSTASEEEENETATGVLSLLDREALTPACAVAADPLFAPGFPGSDAAAGFAASSYDPLPASITLSCTTENEETAKAVQSQLQGQGISVNVVTTADPCNPGTDYNLALVEVNGYNANLVLSRLFAANSEGTGTVFGAESTDLVQLAALMGTRSGRSETNLQLLLSWLEVNPCVTGLYSDVTEIGLTQGLAGESTNNCILIGTITGFDGE